MEKKEEKRDCTEHKWIPLLGADENKTVPTFLFTCLNCGDLKVGTQTIKISRFRMDMGELPINSVAAIKLMNEPSVDNTASGLIIAATVAANDQGIGAPLYVQANGQFNMANATTSATAPCVALAMDTGTGSKRVLLHGVLRNDTWNWTTGPGTAGLVYLSTTAGVLTQTKPSGTDEVIQPVGWALSDDCLYFSPSMMYLTHV
ncbi:MAG: hypothetical protein WCW56_03205 [Candidatus Paceibacterota bacterium]|jgi:hypothetical protein